LKKIASPGGATQKGLAGHWACYKDRRLRWLQRRRRESERSERSPGRKAWVSVKRIASPGGARHIELSQTQAGL
jgi:hypothetical protein